MIHSNQDFFNSIATEIRAKYFATEIHGQTENKNYHAATYAIECFNNGVLNYRTFIGRLAKACNTNNATIHNIVEKYILSFGEYQYKPRRLYSQNKVGI
jgi:hypothetical protein